MPDLKAPSRNDVEHALEQLEIEDDREREAIRAFWNRERADEVAHLSLKWRLFFFFCAAAVAAALVYTFILGPALDGLTGGR